MAAKEPWLRVITGHYQYSPSPAKAQRALFKENTSTGAPCRVMMSGRVKSGLRIGLTGAPPVPGGAHMEDVCQKQ